MAHEPFFTWQQKGLDILQMFGPGGAALVSHGADVNAAFVGRHWEKPLYWAHGGQLPAAQYLFNRGADLNWVGHDQLSHWMRRTGAVLSICVCGCASTGLARPKSLPKWSNSEFNQYAFAVAKEN